MKQKFFIVSLLSSFVIVVFGLNACVGQSSPASAPPGSTVVSTPQPPPTIPPTLIPSGGHGLALTLANNDQRVLVKRGDVILLALDDSFYDQWTISLSDPTILTAIPDVPVPTHAQALYRASKAGQVTIKASGEPRCRKANPPCQIEPKDFTIQITVQ